jgi:hypothetical protein
MNILDIDNKGGFPISAFPASTDKFTASPITDNPQFRVGGDKRVGLLGGGKCPDRQNRIYSNHPPHHSSHRSPDLLKDYDIGFLADEDVDPVSSPINELKVRNCMRGLQKNSSSLCWKGGKANS